MIQKPILILSVLSLLLLGCESANDSHRSIINKAISNNAVAAAQVNGEHWLYSFNGLLAKKDWRSVSAKAFAYNINTKQSKRLGDVPSKSPLNTGRLASIAVTVNNQIYIFGGYTVAQDHSEVSTPEVYRFDPQTENYTYINNMPTPVDDSVALVYQNRYIYLISGWHNTGNVDLVQILDTQTLKWHQGTPYPGATVFGHAAGIVGNKMLVSDGVKVLKVENGKRHYGMSDDNYLGIIDANNFKKIDWRKLSKHPGPARYRMAATGSENNNQILFVGGSDNPYNFNGIGYNGVPSEPTDLIFAYDFSSDNWQKLGKQKLPTMDHRGLLEVNNNFYTVGGILNNQETTNKVIKLNLK